MPRLSGTLIYTAMMHKAVLAALLLVAPLAALLADEPVGSGLVLVEAESFAERGGWVVDPQFMDQMGSPYLLAHGLGQPVADAVTEIEFPAVGVYRVWVRTKDWVAQWNAPGTPGRFQLLVNGQALETTFGTQGTQWHWHDGGSVSISERRTRLTLHDLTTPRGVYESHLSDLRELMRRGTGKNPGSNPDYENAAEPRRQPVAKPSPSVPMLAWLSNAGPNLARAARVMVSGSRDNQHNSVDLLTDGQASLSDNSSRWLSDTKLPHRIELVWETPVQIGAARIISGYNSGGRIVSPITDFTLQWHDGSDWKPIPGAATRDNHDFSWQCVFAPVKTARVRLEATKAQNDISRIWELEFYGPP
ncbi:MAG: hypothetical protein HY000_16630 [Planctomycetes bacterium]|nr:hypothetical protein [Planctomycetota bacterium]